jgi:hypothetical protein
LAGQRGELGIGAPADEGEVEIRGEKFQSADEEVEAFDRIEAADVTDDDGGHAGGRFGPRGGVDGGGVMEARHVDAVGDDGGARDAITGKILKLVDNCLGRGDEGVGTGGEDFLQGPVPAGAVLEGVEGVDEASSE